jgi:hypothetical protein
MGNVRGRDCGIAIRTGDGAAAALPYAEETIREDVSLLREEASIEGDGRRRATRKRGGAAGCVVTPLTIGTAPLLLALAMGDAGQAVYVSETRNVHRRSLRLLTAEDSKRFDVIQDRGGSRKLYEDCVVVGFELRIMRGRAIQLKLDIAGDMTPATLPYSDTFVVETEERFMEDGVVCRINGTEYGDIYGLAIDARKKGGTRIEARLHRVLNDAGELPSVIETLEVTARLFRDCYEWRSLGMFRLRLSRLFLMADETRVDAPDAVIGPLRYYVAGTVSAEVFCNNGELVITTDHTDHTDTDNTEGEHEVL